MAPQQRSDARPAGRRALTGLFGLPKAMPTALMLSAAFFTLPALAQSRERAEETLTAQPPPSTGVDTSDAASLIDQGKYAEAFPLLERQVMLDPDNLAAWIDYALVVDALGRSEEARAVREFIARELAPDEQTRTRLAALSTGLMPPPIPMHQWRAEVSLLSGHESNANAGPSVREITFSVPGDLPFTLPLNQQSLPRPSSSHLLEARLESAHALGGGVGLSTSFDWRQRKTPDAPDAGSRQWQADTTLTFGASNSNGSARQWLLSASLLDYDYGGSTLFRRERLAVGVDQRLGLDSAMPCRIQGTLEHEWRHHPAQDGLISHLAAAQTVALCAKGPHRWVMLVRLGEDQPQASRPGGTQLRQDFSLGYRLDMARWGQAEVQAAYSTSRDSEVYNELFGHTRRRIARTQLYLTYISAPFFGNWQAIARAEIFQQRSNLSLFQMRGRSMHLGLRYSF